MVEISASMVKELREKSGAAMMDCKKALVESEGDFDKAFEWLRQKGRAQASNKASRAASEGLVVGKLSPCNKRAAIIELNCETDFVARNEQFQSFASQLAELALEHKTTSAAALLEQKHGAATVRDLLTEKVQTIGENLVLRRADYIEVTGHGVIGLYIHAVGGKLGAMVALEANREASAEEVLSTARDVAMHIVSSKPQFVDRSQVPADVLENERRIELGKEDLAEKPAEIREKIVTGRVNKLIGERVLLEQDFVKDPSRKISQILKVKPDLELKATAFKLYILGAQDDAATETNGH